MRRTYTILFLILLCLLLYSCAGRIIETTLSSERTIEETSAVSTMITTVSTTVETAVLLNPKDAFILSLMDAINTNDVAYLSSVTKMTHYGADPESIAAGLSLFQTLVENKPLTHYTPWSSEGLTLNPEFSMVRLETDTGISRIILIYQEVDVLGTFTFYDPLIIMGPNIESRVMAYFIALKNQDIAYLYNYQVMCYEDSDAKPYGDPEQTQQYVDAAVKLIEVYQTTMSLDSMTIEMTQIHNDATLYSSVALIEYTIHGLSPTNEPVTHTITGIYDMPITAILDDWFPF